MSSRPHDALRAALGSYATGVAVVTARAPDGGPVAMTINSFAAVSLQPPLVLWSAQRGVYPFEVFALASHFAVHVLHAGQVELSNRCAGTDPDRFQGLESRTGVAGLPLLDDCLALFQCETLHRQEGGDHLVLMGRVLEHASRPGAPLVFQGGRYRELAPVPEVPDAG